MVRRAGPSTRNTARPISSKRANSFWAISTNTACCPILSISRSGPPRPFSGGCAGCGSERRAPDLGHNGTYLVVRQVAQWAHQLWDYLDAATKDAAGQSRPAEREKLGSKLVGRWPSGAPMALAPDQDDPGSPKDNDFLYNNTDPSGLGCPFGSHIRRGNPRDTLGEDPAEALKITRRHRLIRRGRSYGPRATSPVDPNDKQERGLMFMVINANIERQFEFVQQTWINSPSFHGLYDERDPIFGSSSARGVDR